MFPTKFQVKWPFSSGEEVKNRFSKWLPWWPSWIFKMATMAAIWDFLSQRFELFLTYKSPQCFLPSFKSIGLSVQKKGKIDFQDGRHLGFPIRMILAIFISKSHPDASYQFSNQLALWFRKISEKKSFKMAAITASLDFRSKQFKLF